jgi:predicted acylesterase/phospholipase RssA
MCPTGPEQIVLVFQAGDALGAYQAFIYQALHESGIEPDWIIGTSIGAINARVIAGIESSANAEGIRATLLECVVGRGTHCSVAFQQTKRAIIPRPAPRAIY